MEGHLNLNSPFKRTFKGVYIQLKSGLTKPGKKSSSLEYYWSTIGVLLETPMNVSFDTPIISFKTPRFSLETPRFLFEIWGSPTKIWDLHENTGGIQREFGGLEQDVNVGLHSNSILMMMISSRTPFLD